MNIINSSKGYGFPISSLWRHILRSISQFGNPNRSSAGKGWWRDNSEVCLTVQSINDIND